MQDQTAERIAENEATFRRYNEEIRATAQKLDFPDAIPFICECGDVRCREIVRLARGEYEAVRADPTHFFVVPGHASAAEPNAKTVGGGNGYLIVEKVGRAGAVASEQNPRATQ